MKLGEQIPNKTLDIPLQDGHKISSNQARHRMKAMQCSILCYKSFAFWRFRRLVQKLLSSSYAFVTTTLQLAIEMRVER